MTVMLRRFAIHLEACRCVWSGNNCHRRVGLAVDHISGYIADTLVWDDDTTRISFPTVLFPEGSRERVYSHHQCPKGPWKSQPRPVNAY